MPFEDLGRKSHWIEEAAGPARKVQEKMVRALVDLPSDVTPGARQIAIVTKHRSAQAHLLEPIMTALRELEALPDWTGGFLVFDNINTTWRDAPFKHYASFSDFYTQELAETWGAWEHLQETYRAYSKGEIDDVEVNRRLGKHGGDRKSAAVKDQGCNTTLKRGTREHWLARLDRDGHAELAAQVRERTISANKAALAAGFRKQPSHFETILKWLPKLTPDERHRVHEETADR